MIGLSKGVDGKERATSASHHDLSEPVTQTSEAEEKDLVMEELVRTDEQCFKSKVS